MHTHASTHTLHLILRAGFRQRVHAIRQCFDDALLEALQAALLLLLGASGGASNISARWAGLVVVCVVGGLHGVRPTGWPLPAAR